MESPHDTYAGMHMAFAVPLARGANGHSQNLPSGPSRYSSARRSCCNGPYRVRDTRTACTSTSRATSAAETHMPTLQPAEALLDAIARKMPTVRAHAQR